jgi:hypothetical protein
MSKDSKTRKKEKSAKPQKAKKVIPLPINIIGWFGIALSATYLIWSIVNIILSIMDHTYADLGQNIVILIYGLPILVMSTGFRNMQKWSWYGLVIILVFVVIWTAITLESIYGAIWGILALAALIGIFTPSVRKHYITH